MDLAATADSTSERRKVGAQVTDFRFRSLVVDDVWIPLGENMMIEQFQPVWNRVIDGFGNKTPGVRRVTQYRSLWDVLHPGRKFAEKLADSGVAPEAVEERLALYFAGHAVPLVSEYDAADAGADTEEE